MGKEHTQCVSFHLMPLCICPNAPLFIYSPLLFHSLFPFSCSDPKREGAGLYRPCAAQACAVPRNKKSIFKQEQPEGGEADLKVPIFLFSDPALNMIYLDFDTLFLKLYSCICRFMLVVLVLSGCPDSEGHSKWGRCKDKRPGLLFTREWQRRREKELERKQIHEILNTNVFFIIPTFLKLL